MLFRSQSDIDSAIDDLEIGGRNLILNSKTWEGKSLGSARGVTFSREIVDGESVVLVNYDGVTATPYFRFRNIVKDLGWLTYSVEAKLVSGAGALSLQINDRGSINHTLSDEWDRYCVSVKNDRLSGVYNFVNMYPRGGTGAYSFYIRLPKLEKGTIATDWTPAPEDQIADWNSTNSNSFDFIKNKPTKLSQFSNVETDFTSKTYVTTELNKKVDKVSGKSLISDTEISRLSTVTNQTATSIGLGNVTNESKATMFTNPTFTGTTKVTVLELNTNWKFVKVGNNIELQYNGVTKQEMTSDGHIISHGDVTALLDN